MNELLAVNWTGGGNAQITVLNDDHITLLTTRPFAPGSRPEGTLGASALRMKTARCRLAKPEERTVMPQSEPVYLLEGRLLDASRAFRTAISEALIPKPSEEPA